MTLDEALQNITVAVESVNANRQTHVLLGQSLDLIKAKLKKETASVTEIKPQRGRPPHGKQPGPGVHKQGAEAQ